MTTNRSNGSLTISDIFQGFRDILRKAPRHSYVRQSVISAICNLLNPSVHRDDTQEQPPQVLQEIANRLRPLLNELTREEIDQITETIRKIYLWQRQHLEGGNNEFYLKTKRYSIWVRGTRPLTTIEEIISEWLGNKEYPIAQQVAMQAKIDFAKALDQAEEKYIQKILGQPGIANIELERPDIVQRRRFFLDTIVAWLATIDIRPYLPVVATVLPEVFHQDKSSPDVVKFVIRKGQNNEDDIIGTNLAINTTSHRLGTGLLLAKNPWIWAIPGSILAVGSLYGIAYVIKNLPPLPPPPSPKEPSKKGISVLPPAHIKNMHSANFDMGKITVEFSNGATVDDRIWIHHQGRNQGQIGTQGNHITYEGEVIAKVEGGDDDQPLIVTFNDQSTPEAAKALLQDIKYATVSKQPQTGSRELTFKMSNGKENSISKSFTKIINLATENQAPIVKLTGNKTVQKCSDLPIDSINISDVDSQKLTVTLHVNNGILNLQSAEAKGTKTSKTKSVKLDKFNLTKGVENQKSNVPKQAKFVNGLTVRGNKTKTIVLTGTVDSIKTVLANPNAITYHSDKDFSGEDSLTVTVNDHGKTISDATDNGLVYPENALTAKTGEDQKINITVRSF